MRPLIIALQCLFLTACSSAAEPQRANASTNLVQGIAAYNRGDFQVAYKLLRAAADRGEPEAMVNLGYMYARGHGTASDPAFALQLYRRAADAGDAEAMNAVGFRYNFAPIPDLDQAIHWYCLAVLHGNSRAMNNLGLLVARGQGVLRNQAEARNLWRQAAQRGNVNAQTNLALDLMRAPTQAERLEGLKTLRDAAMHGGMAAQNYLWSRGDYEPMPPASFSELTMRLEPHDPAPGTSSVCAKIVS
ncbi:MAG TPA: tetratricopeptide repeat protein [Acetobacteraceae bacterium]|nr:tetratricopeptide repeat protein [Acetobacteraceae bacterium]